MATKLRYRQAATLYQGRQHYATCVRDLEVKNFRLSSFFEIEAFTAKRTFIRSCSERNVTSQLTRYILDCAQRWHHNKTKPRALLSQTRRLLAAAASLP